MTALYDAYFAAWTRCKMERDGKPPRARFVQELGSLDALNPSLLRCGLEIVKALIAPYLWGTSQ